MWHTLRQTVFTIASAAFHHALYGQIQRVQFVLVHSVAYMLYRACYDHATENSHGTAITLLQWVSGCFLNISITTGISGTWSFYGDLGRKSMHRPRASSYVAILSVDCASRSREWASTAIDAAFTDDANEKAAHEPAASPVRYGRSFRATLLDIRQRQNRARDRSTSRAHNKQLDKCMTDKGGKWVQSGCYSPASIPIVSATKV